MEELKCSPTDLKYLIEDSQIIGRGFFATVFTYKDRLIKLDTNLYRLLKSSPIADSDSMFEEYLSKQKISFVNPKQIEELSLVSKNIVLSKMPLGIVSINDSIPGVIIPYHKEHNNLSLIPKDSYKKLLLVLRNLLTEVRELADNKVAQNDLNYGYSIYGNYNVLVKDSVPQIIDLDGGLVTCGKTYEGSQKMYRQLGDVILGYFDYSKIKSEIPRSYLINDEHIKYLLDELEQKSKYHI